MPSFLSRQTRYGVSYNKLYSICALIYLNSTMAGLDASLIGNLNTLPSFQSFFGTGTSKATTGMIFASMQVGGILGAFTLRLADSRGRLFCIQIGSIGVICGALIQAFSRSMWMFMVGRFTLGFFSTLACRSSSIYLIEISPAERRGTIAGLYNTLFFLGSILATLAVLISQSIYHGHAAWRVPVALQCVFPAIVASGVRYIPESPRWLAANSRSSEARDVMTSLHSNGVLTNKVSEEFARMEIDVKQRDGMPTGWSVLYSSKSRKRRLFILLCMSLFGQMSGNNIISYYLPTMLHDVGIKEMSTKLYLNGLYAIIGWTAAAVGARLHDYYGRRKMLYNCTSGLATCMGLLALSMGMYYRTGEFLYSTFSLLTIYTFGVIFATGYTSMQPVYPAEVMTNDMRARGMAVATMCGGSAGCLNTLLAPAAMARLGPMFFFLFCVWDFIEAVVINAYFVETKGRTLEELEEVFNSDDPVGLSIEKSSKERMF
ncbi:hypothetical protein TWF569_001675 [Orbilia oligospora]|uniref:Major facilitator superfamily (MFS) profile domain-containing protein n=2 Tax=Orbilia oligospora TaxID=2813651 RepID=A0A7C8N0C1_ORBOL|nr:hypothetical protein TWF102_001040 [Orbilia oligospora]KAF3083547.1 hypothetical protein TWF706_001162 [Orbilia oligospora]KAF3095053.1 hypothetical protein TWF103_010342 [Orbilia oligospora]KAF3122775.1 hypothetical protein TWF594_002746 [Orbilia oligospora]KAF3123584.1 hypothetical protein TWF569_001675 [Orbilia oligospora]